jgi:hypothetical protein
MPYDERQRYAPVQSAGHTLCLSAPRERDMDDDLYAEARARCAAFQLSPFSLARHLQTEH